MGKASYAKTETIPTAEKGDTFTGYEFTVEVNGSALDLTDAVIVLTLDNGMGSLTTVGSGGLTITGVATGKVKIDKQVINFPAKKHHYEMTFTLSSGDVKTYIEGPWLVTQ